MTSEITTNKIIRILYIASEAEPLVKVGGLGDVAGSLPRSLRVIDPKLIDGYTLDVRLVLPYHAVIKRKIKELKIDTELISSFPIDTINGPISAGIIFSQLNVLPVYFISGDPIPSNAPVYSQDPCIDGIKYTFFSIAALQMLPMINWKPDIIQANDWHAAISVYSLPSLRARDKFYSQIHSIQIIHNLPYMGGGCTQFDPLTMYRIPPAQDPILPQWAINIPLPLGILNADLIVTVSPTYADEIKSPQFACGLETLINARQDSLLGIINGLDPEEWNPESDKGIEANYSFNTIDAKSINKNTLLLDFSLNPDPAIPLFIMVTRMDYQKGIDIAIDALRMISDLPWQIIILGSGDPILENVCRTLQADFPDKVRALIKYDDKLAHRMYAGGDCLIMPSRYEPCGLAQMIAMRYGCIPIASATGGLCDTIHDDANIDKNNGFLFSNNSPHELSETLKKVITLYTDQPFWQQIQRNGMRQEFSWNKSAIEYANTYLKLCSK